MRTYELAFLGFGNVARALAGLLARKAEELRHSFGISWRVTGVASRRLGWLANPNGLELDVPPGAAPRGGTAPAPVGLSDWLRVSGAQILFEMTSLQPQTGQPALDHVRQALRQGLHVITANKGPVVYGYRELRDLAAQTGRRFLFESTVMDGTPIFSLFREALPAARLLRFRGVLNSTTNYILTEMEAGCGFDEAVHKAQAIGIAETDPGVDIDGWDAAVKVSALVTVLMDIPFSPSRVERAGIRGLSAEAVRAGRAAGRPFKLLCSAERTASGVAARVAPEQLDLTDPLASVSGTSSAVHFETDVLPGLSVFEHNPGPETTAYGLLADFLRIVQDESRERGSAQIAS